MVSKTTYIIFLLPLCLYLDLLMGAALVRPPSSQPTEKNWDEIYNILQLSWIYVCADVGDYIAKNAQAKLLQLCQQLRTGIWWWYAYSSYTNTNEHVCVIEKEREREKLFI